MTELTPPSPNALPNDDEIALCAPNTAVRSATATLMLAGFITSMLGIQLATSLRFHDPLLQASLYAMIGVGAFAMYLGNRMYRMRAWAAVAGTVTALLLSAAMTTWLVYSFSQRLFTLFALGAPPMAFAATILGFKAIAPTRRATEIRERLQDAGIELGF